MKHSKRQRRSQRRILQRRSHYTAFKRLRDLQGIESTAQLSIDLGPKCTRRLQKPKINHSTSTNRYSFYRLCDHTALCNAFAAAFQPTTNVVTTSKTVQPFTIDFLLLEHLKRPRKVKSEYIIVQFWKAQGFNIELLTFHFWEHMNRPLVVLVLVVGCVFV